MREILRKGGCYRRDEAINGFRGTFVVSSSLLLVPLFVRPDELRRAEWSGFDRDRAEWRYRVTKTKTERPVRLVSPPSRSCANCTD